MRTVLGVASVVVGVTVASMAPAFADDCGDGDALDGAYACGVDAKASGSPTNSAFGNEAHAFDGGHNTAVGAGASAFNGANATALGSDATAFGSDTTAVGAGADAGFAGSTAIGKGVATTRANQVAIGTGTATYTLAGLPSAASTSAQSGTTYMVTTDSDGNLAASTFDFAALSGLPAAVAQNSSDISALQGTVSGHTTELANHETRITNNESDISLHTTQIASLDTRVTTNTADIATNTANIATNTANIATNTANIATNTANIALLDGRVGSLESGLNAANGRIDKAFEGTAMALAMAGSGLPGDKNYAVSLNWGTFEGENAFAGSAQARISENVILSGGIGVGASNHTVGGRAGLTVAW